jgi:MoaA/NifB/PqqE/SkfB family radical SAM enzyme
VVGLIDPSGKILRHPDVLTRMRNGEHVWPLNVELDPSNRCNAKCRHCDFAHVHNGALLDGLLAYRVLAELSHGGTQGVTLTGGGEPTVHPLFSDIALCAQALGLAVGVYTNGLRSEPLIDCIGALSWVYVSLDAVGADEYRTVKGADVFWRAVETIQQLVTARRGGTLTVGVGFLLDSDNWRDAAAMATLALALGADYAQFRPIVGLSAYAWVMDALPTLDALTGENIYVSRQRFIDLRDGTQRCYTVCRASELVPCIGADGTVWVCPNTRGLRSLGNLHDQTFPEIWERRPDQLVGADCRVACRNHALNETLEHVCGVGPHDAFV